MSIALDGLVDTLGQPLRPPPAYQAIRDRGAEYIANDIPTAGDPASTQAIVGDFSQVLFGMTQGMQIEVSRDGTYKNDDGTTGSAFGQGQILLRCFVMVDVAIQRPGFFTVLKDIRV